MIPCGLPIWRVVAVWLPSCLKHTTRKGPALPQQLGFHHSHAAGLWMHQLLELPVDHKVTPQAYLIFSSQCIKGIPMGSALQVCSFLTSSPDYGRMQFRLRFKNFKSARNTTKLPRTEKGHCELHRYFFVLKQLSEDPREFKISQFFLLNNSAIQDKF